MNIDYDIEWLSKRFDTGESLKFIYFWGHTKKYNQKIGEFCFSQWFESPFKLNGLTYKTTEHWMMSQKAKLFGNFDLIDKIIHCDNPAEAKEFGRQVINFDDMIWNQHRFEIVKLGNIHKFNQNKDLGDYLIQTNDRIIVEASPTDLIWGIGLSKDSEAIDNIYAWRGLNLLGFALMEVRDFLNSFGYFEYSDIELIPPWIKYPKIEKEDMFWRMGTGEQFLIDFDKEFNKLVERDNKIYQLTNPEPFDWRGFYNN
jgi:ribA/ribD-fused uncharacterized protein